MSKNVCVLGAGIIGVSSAVVIQEFCPNIQVTIVAEKFSPNNLTSDVAAGFIEPYLCPEGDRKTILKWCKATIKYIRNYMKEHPNGGAQEISGYFFQENIYEEPFWSGVMSNFRRLTPVEVAEKHSLPQKSGFFYTTLYLQPTQQIEFLMKKFLSNGGICLSKKVKNLTDLANDFEIIVNCTGIEAKFLVNDSELVPIRGQNMKVLAPQIKHFFVDDNFHVLLNDDCTIIGGTREVNDWNLKVDEPTIQKIIEGNCRNIPALKDAIILSHHVGLRPFRPKVRLEKELLRYGNKHIQVIHSYGHGGSGVTLFWGCALDVAQLVQEELNLSKL